MKKSAYRLCSAFLAVLILSVAVVPCYAASDKYTSTGTFWQAVADKWYFNGTFIPTVIGTVSDKVCSESGDKKHHGSLKSYEQNPDKSYTAICDFCSAEFPVYDADLSAAYDDYVQTLPAQGYTSAGRIIWQSTAANLSELVVLKGSGGSSPSPVDSGLYVVSYSGSTFTLNFDCENWPSSSLLYVKVSLSDFPVVGSYGAIRDVYGSLRCLSSSGKYTVFDSSSSNLSTAFCHYKLKDVSVLYSLGSFPASPRSYLTATATFSFPRFEVIPDTVSGDTYNTNTRPTSITGGNYGIVGDNGQITKVEDNSTIINETNNTFYNPATGQTVPIVNWSYDYSDRSYKVTLESGDTATITYGDENITISQITTTEGDTITNNYTIYYLIDGSGSGEICAHEWTETSTTPATCTLPGSKLLTCSKCQQTKKDPIPALGHDWQIKQTVTTQYDDTGQLIQEGYTIYECSRCKEQYKSASGTSPPTNPSDPDASGEGVFSGIFGLLLDFLSFFWKTFKDFTKSGVKAFLDALRDGTSDIFGLLNPFDWSA